MRLLGVDEEIIRDLDGRVLRECLSEGRKAPREKPKVETFTSRNGSYGQFLQRTVYEGRAYLDCGYRVS
jgi:hypothetical protein